MEKAYRISMKALLSIIDQSGNNAETRLDAIRLLWNLLCRGLPES